MEAQVWITYVLSAVTLLLLVPSINKAYEDSDYKHDPATALMCFFSGTVFIIFGLDHNRTGIVWLNAVVVTLSVFLLVAYVSSRRKSVVE